MNMIDTMKKIVRTAIFVLVAASVVMSCDKPYEIEQPLGVTTKTVNLQSKAGVTPVVVYASEGWTATLTENVEWASIDRLQGYGLSEIKFSYSQNFGAARKVGIIFHSSKEIPDTVMMIQAAGNSHPIFQFSKGETIAPKIKGVLKLGFSTDLVYDIDNIRYEIKYDQEDNIDWLKNITISSEAVTCDIEENNSGFDRSATLTVLHTDAAGKNNSTFMKIKQVTTAPELTIYDKDIKNGLECIEQEIELPIVSNMTAYINVMKAEVTYEGTQVDWISDLTFDEKKLSFKVSTNEMKENRSADITLSFTDSQGQTYSFSTTVLQTKFVMNYSFETLKALIVAETGELAISTANKNEGTLRAFVIGDKDNENMDKNPNTRPREIDWNGNPTTNYIQNADGTSGLKLKCSTVADNVFDRYSEIVLNLDGVTLVKETNPTRYTLRGITSANVLSNVEGYSDNVPYKEKTISQLTDEDIYTYTTLKNLEMTFKYGAYTNCHDGYSLHTALNPKGNDKPFYDAVPSSLRDAEGGSLYMVTNMKTPWRRTGNGVFQGTANISGIIDHCNMIRYAKDGDIGRYSIRILEENDIASSGSRFSKTLVEWNWHGQTSHLTTPTTGNGSLTFSMEGTTIGTDGEYNMLKADGASKGSVSNGAIKFERNYWWDDTHNAAPYFLIEFSTSEISGSQLCFNWSISQGNGGGNAITAPAYWHIEYSTDGVHFTRLEKEYAVRPLVWWNNDLSLSAIPGLHEYTTVLPASLFGKEKVFLKLIASSKVAATANADVEGEVTDKSGNRIKFGDIAVEYN